MTFVYSDIEPTNCLLWPRFPTKRVTLHPDTERLACVLGSPRAGGDYAITDEALRRLNGIDSRVNDSIRARLTTILIGSRASGIQCPVVDSDLIDQAVAAPPMALRDRARRLLEFIDKRCETYGQAFSLNDEDPDYYEDPPAAIVVPFVIVNFWNRYGALAWTESANDDELRYVWEYIRDDKKWITTPPNIRSSPLDECTITRAGRESLDDPITDSPPRQTLTDSAQAFVAMWFHDSMGDVYELAIAPAIRDAGYEPFRVDRGHFANTITEEIVKQMRQSRFVVADLTHGKDGARGSVYYEAGFAHGIDIPVIFTAEDGTKPHFDTSTYPHIFWKHGNLTALKAQLQERIMSLKELGPGPGRV